MGLNVKIQQYLPTNVVQIAHIDGDVSSPDNATSITYKDVNPGLAGFSFLTDYAFDVILNSGLTSGELGIGILGLLDNNILITNIASASRFGTPIPLFYKYNINNLTIVMPVNEVRYAYLKVSAITASELEELAEMELIIDNSILDRIYFTDLYNVTKSIKFNISKTYVSGTSFNVTIYVQNSSKTIGSLYIIYNSGVSTFRKILNSIPIFTRKSWNLGNVFYGVN